ncbi:hypothetical protein FOZ61_008357 [Perkinsus olseni]|uniref:Uncharacterized protein n=1 Tax=Perkinsus olseni TaxID=32597 RepID=A0A7J6LCR3_PEROL|nr:hypothetical protein FOZ61_008357 [Perkinsus olseni]KAF4657012.1 hypothetical protein FOL46_007597 [Perkinsus olseni]
MTLSWFLLIASPSFGYSAGTRGKYTPRQPSPLLHEEKHTDGSVDGGYPCSVTCPLDGINYDHCRVSLAGDSGSSELTCVSPRWVVSKNVSDVFEAAASTEIANSSGPPSCRDKLQYWVLDSPFDEVATGSGKSAGCASLDRGHREQVLTDPESPRAVDENELPKNVVLHQANKKFWEEDPFVNAIWQEWNDDPEGSDWDPCFLRAPTRRNEKSLNNCHLGLLNRKRTYLWCEDFGRRRGVPKLKSLSPYMELFTTPNVHGGCYGRITAFVQSAIYLETEGMFSSDEMIDAFYKAIEEDLGPKRGTSSYRFEMTSPDTFVSYALELLHDALPAT